jgi:hypothetical protein
MTTPTCQRCGKSLWLHAEMDYTGETDIAVCGGFMKEKEIELYGMTLAELDTEVEVAKSAEVDEYVKTIKWSNDTDDYTKTLIIGNIRGFAFRETTPETPINGFINKLAQRFAEVSAREARLVEALESTANASRQTLDIIKRERFVFDDLTDRWQKLAFTIYTELTQASTDAKNALAEHRGEKANTEEKHDDG